MRLQERIRAVTDALGADEWLTPHRLYENLSEPKPDAKQVCTELSRMHSANTLQRRGKRGYYEYRSGLLAVTDGRSARKGGHMPNPRSHGFMGLARLRESDFKAWQKAIAQDPASWRAAVAVGMGGAA